MKKMMLALALFALGCEDKVQAPPPPKPPPAPAEQPKVAPPPAAPAKDVSALLEPRLLTQTAPDTYKAKFETSRGTFVIEVTREWAPKGADRFYNLVKNGYFDDVRFFRVIQAPRKFMAQFGINGDPRVNAVWRDARIEDDPVKKSNERGMISFATSGPNSRTTQVFINYDNNARLDGMGFSPFGKVIEGMEIVDGLYAEYGEGYPNGRGPDQGRLQAQGNAYLIADFPKLDYVKKATIE
jgi:peptidyl-prolyl cis-trans isomerase A (cyclophilin A)